MRATMLEVLNDEFIVMARMKGLSRWSIVMRHAARNALLPVVTAFALGLGASIGGNVVIETVFAWPGIGRVLVQAVQGADYPVAQGAFILIAFVLVVMNTVADLAYALLDPRVSVGAQPLDAVVLAFTCVRRAVRGGRRRDLRRDRHHGAVRARACAVRPARDAARGEPHRALSADIQRALARHHGGWLRRAEPTHLRRARGVGGRR